MVLTQPIIQLKNSQQVPASVKVLIDRSASMGIVQKGSDRQNDLADFLNSDGFNEFLKKYRIKIYGFTDSLAVEEKSLESFISNRGEGIGSDLGKAFKQALTETHGETTSLMLLISDGAHNVGEDPARLARSSRIPIWTIGVGSPEMINDALILKVIHNPVVYQGSITPVEIEYRCIGAKDNNLALTIRDKKGIKIARKQISISENYEEGIFKFDLEVKASGKLQYSAEISQLDDEPIIANNKKSFFLNSLPDKMRVLVMAGYPDTNLGDLIRRLKSDKHVDLTTRITKNRTFYEGDWPDEALLIKTDIVFFHNFPVKTHDMDKLRGFAELLSNAELPVCFFDGNHIYKKGLELFSDHIPVEINKQNSRFATGFIKPNNKHAIIADPEDASFQDHWKDLPPLVFNTNSYSPLKNSNIIAEFHQQESLKKYPGIIVSEVANQKTVAFLGQNLWRLGFAGEAEKPFWNDLISRLLRWLSLRRNDKKVAVSFNKDTYSSSETIAYHVTVYNENLLPIEDAIVSCEISHKDTIGVKTILKNLGGGRYCESFTPWGDGEYKLHIKASDEESMLGTDTGRIIVEPFNIELLNTRLNDELLQAISGSSNGRYSHISFADSLLLSINLPEKTQESIFRFEFQSRSWLLLIIIVLLAVEWLIRIRTGML